MENQPSSKKENINQIQENQETINSELKISNSKIQYVRNQINCSYEKAESLLKESNNDVSIAISQYFNEFDQIQDPQNQEEEKYQNIDSNQNAYKKNLHNQMLKNDFLQQFQNLALQAKEDQQIFCDRVYQNVSLFQETISQNIQKDFENYNSKINEFLNQIVQDNQKNQKEYILIVQNEKEQIQKEANKFQQKTQQNYQKLIDKIKIQYEQSVFSQKEINSDMINLNLTGNIIQVSKNTLCKIKGSKLQNLFQSDTIFDKDQNGSIILDRNPDIFKYVIEYLRQDRRCFPKNIDSDIQKQIEMEIKFWGLDKGLFKVNSLCHEMVDKIQNLLNSEPEVELQGEAMKTWRRLGPIQIKEFVENTNIPLDFDDSIYQFGDRKKSNCVEYGSMKFSGWTNEGILRQCVDKNKIYEIQCYDWKWSGFARYIKEDGRYYIGLLKDGKKHGYGTYYQKNGQIHKQGIWIDGNLQEF